MSKEQGDIIDAEFTVSQGTSQSPIKINRRELLRDFGTRHASALGILAFLSLYGSGAVILEHIKNDGVNSQGIETITNDPDTLTDQKSEVSNAGFYIRHPAKTPGIIYEAMGNGKPEFVIESDTHVAVTDVDTTELVDTEFFPQMIISDNGDSEIALTFKTEVIDQKFSPSLLPSATVEYVVQPYLLNNREATRIETNVVEFGNDKSQWYYVISEEQNSPDGEPQFAFTQLNKITQTS